MKGTIFALSLGLTTALCAAPDLSGMALPNGALAAVLQKQGEIAALKAEITAAATAAAKAPDAVTRENEWKKVETGEQKFYSLIQGDFGGAKLSKADQQAAIDLYNAEAAQAIKNGLAQLQDPEAKKFFEEKLKKYEPGKKAEKVKKAGKQVEKVKKAEKKAEQKAKKVEQKIEKAKKAKKAAKAEKTGQTGK